MSDKFMLSSPAFAAGQTIPAKYACRGENISPPLEISCAPEGAMSLALIMHDPDAPGSDWLHWTLWNISPDIKEIGENSVPAEAIQGQTDFGNVGYGGPCPPSGTHRYVFDLYALDTMLDLPAGSGLGSLQQAMARHELAHAQLIGTVSAK
jgi:Raf kinase inhibitor-like YbhB/YbcL family protein